uniref:Uncharacterized protein n=2 Tax=Manihot esculenta TaxID=3983 RepID=A0A2C9W3L2_MANES
MGWILVTLAFILCGIFLILHKNPFCQTSSVVADTCVAVDDWLQNPSANAPLSLQFLPCMDNETAQETLKATKQTSFYVINVVNKFIIEASNRDLPPDAGILYVNQSGPPVPLLCNPYYPDLTERDCSHAEVNFGNVAQEWRKHVCEVSDEGLCITQGRLTPKICDQMTVAVNISYSLYSSGEFLVQLGDCSFVLKTFSEINENYCPDLRRYSFWTYVGLRIVATSVMCATVLWMVYSRERRIRVFTKELTEQNHFP